MLNRCSNYTVKIACRQEKIQIIAYGNAVSVSAILKRLTNHCFGDILKLNYDITFYHFQIKYKEIQHVTYRLSLILI